MTCSSVLVCLGRAVTIVCAVFGITMVGVGSAYLHSCPLNRMVPVFVIMHGLICIWRLPFFIFGCLGLLKPSACRFWCCFVFFGIFEIGWLLYGTVIVAGASPYGSSASETHYCHEGFLTYSKVAVALMYFMFTGMCITAFSDHSEWYADV